MRGQESVFIAVVAGLLCWGSATAGQHAAADPGRPRIALVLGGGGAKGAAHIGVLRALEELRVPVDCVTGTSMGALIGATFAAGARPADIESAVLAVNWSSTLSASQRYSDFPIQRKLNGANYSNSLEFGLKAGRPATAGGLLDSQAIDSLLRELVAGARRTADFDDLPLPFRAVATDMLAAEMVVLGNGDLALAMRASMAVPGVFAPVKVGDRVLADGGQLRNLPVDVGRELCGDVVIAVSITTPPPDPDSLGNPLGLLSRSIDVMIDANTFAQLATLTEQDVSIAIDPGDISSVSFERVADVIPLGYAATLAQAKALQPYAVSKQEYQHWRDSLVSPNVVRARPQEVVVAGLRRVNPAFVRAQLQATKAGEIVDMAGLRADTDRIYATGYFDRVGYQMFGDPEQPRLIISPAEKSHGPNFLRFDIGLAASNGGDFGFVVSADHALTWINRYGGEWRNTLAVGTTSLAETSFTQPLDIRQRFFVRPSLRVRRSLEDLYDDGDPQTDYNFDEWYARLALGMNLGTRAQISAALDYGAAQADLRGNFAGLPETGWSREVNVDLRATYDTRDSRALPTRGSFFTARYLRSDTWLGGEQSYALLEALILKSVPLGNDTLYLLGAAGRELDGDLPGYRLFRLGGLRSFPGLERYQLRGSGYWTGAIG
jgi:NTE family protein